MSTEVELSGMWNVKYSEEMLLFELTIFLVRTPTTYKLEDLNIIQHQLHPPATTHHRHTQHQRTSTQQM